MEGNATPGVRRWLLTDSTFNEFLRGEPLRVIYISVSFLFTIGLCVCMDYGHSREFYLALHVSTRTHVTTFGRACYLWTNKILHEWWTGILCPQWTHSNFFWGFFVFHLQNASQQIWSQLLVVSSRKLCCKITIIKILIDFFITPLVIWASTAKYSMMNISL